MNRENVTISLLTGSCDRRKNRKKMRVPPTFQWKVQNAREQELDPRTFEQLPRSSGISTTRKPVSHSHRYRARNTTSAMQGKCLRRDHGMHTTCFSKNSPSTSIIRSKRRRKLRSIARTARKSAAMSRARAARGRNIRSATAENVCPCQSIFILGSGVSHGWKCGMRITTTWKSPPTLKSEKIEVGLFSSASCKVNWMASQLCTLLDSDLNSHGKAATKANRCREAAGWRLMAPILCRVRYGFIAAIVRGLPCGK